MDEESLDLIKKIQEIQYDREAFSMRVDDHTIVIGAIMQEDNDLQRFSTYAALYNAVLDVDEKVKVSLANAIHYAPPLSKYNPFCPQSEVERASAYYTENAIFRTEILWDLLAQMFNLKEGLGKPIDKVYAKQVFHDSQQGIHGSIFAKKVYAYMEEETKDDPLCGNYRYVKEYRNKMTHRISPSITSLSSFDALIRMPMLYEISRVVEDYCKVSQFISELVDAILNDFYQTDSVPEETI